MTVSSVGQRESIVYREMRAWREIPTSSNQLVEKDFFFPCELSRGAKNGIAKPVLLLSTDLSFFVHVYTSGCDSYPQDANS